MASVQILSPFEIFTDVDGNPLEDGFVFIGQAGLDPVANPVSTFFDAALSVPAAQPIRTKGGYASNAGAPSRVYIAETSYSVLVRNKNSTVVLTALTSPAPFMVAPASSTDNELPLFSGTAGNLLKLTGTIVTAAGRALLDDATAAAQRTTLGSGAVGDAVFVAATQAAARTAIGVTPGTDVQAQDADLQALADNATNGLWARTGSGTGAARTITGTANKIDVANGNGVSANPTLTIPDAVTLVTPTVTSSINLTGGQIAFPATQIPSAGANTLDDYEKATWTPVLTAATPGDLNVVYSVQAGSYTKVGRSVLLSFSVITSTFTHTTASGNARLTGVPFAAAATLRGVSGMAFGGITKAGYTQFSPQIVGGASEVTIAASGSAQANATLQITEMPTGGTVVLISSLSYNV